MTWVEKILHFLGLETVNDVENKEEEDIEYNFF